MINNILVIVSEFNRQITANLAKGAVHTLQQAGGYSSENIDVVWVPGSFELPLIAAKAAKYGRYQGIICLGCVVRGETPHFDYVCQEAARGIMDVGLKAELPVIFGVLTVNTLEQAHARSRWHEGDDAEQGHPLYQQAHDSASKQVVNNKGVEAAHAALQMIRLMSSHPGQWLKGFPL
jgi:6,7-dimethyl-8-ribityllumazine synthase